MAGIRRIDDSPGWINRRFEAIEKRIGERSAEKRIPGTSFPPGVIPTSALRDPSAPGYVNLTTTGFGVTVAGGNVIDTTVTVPEGFTACVVSLVGRVFAYNSTAAPDYLYARPVVNGLAGNALPFPVAAFGSFDDSGVAVCNFATVLTGLSAGSTFPVQLWSASATADWTADASHTADLTGPLLWFA